MFSIEYPTHFETNVINVILFDFILLLHGFSHLLVILQKFPTGGHGPFFLIFVFPWENVVFGTLISQNRCVDDHLNLSGNFPPGGGSCEEQLPQNKQWKMGRWTVFWSIFLLNIEYLNMDEVIFPLR